MHKKSPIKAISNISRIKGVLNISTDKNTSISKGPNTSSKAGIWAKVENEIEARFLVPKHELKEKLTKCRSIKIQQYYVSQRKHLKLIRALNKFCPQVTSVLALDLKTVRLRSQKTKNSEICYYVQFKTNKKSLSRIELSVPINKSCFEKLLFLADEGYVSKTRFIQSAYFNLAGKREKIEAHIDLISELGLGKNRISGNNLPKFLDNFVIVEVELPSESSYKLIKGQAWGNFSFLTNSINLQEVRTGSLEKVSFKALSRGKVSKSKIQRVFEKVKKAA